MKMLKETNTKHHTIQMFNVDKSVMLTKTSMNLFDQK